MLHQQLIDKIILWRNKKGRHRQFVLILSFIVGLLSGFAAVILKNTVYYTHYFITNGFEFEKENFLYLAFPLIGIFLTVLLVRYVIKDNIGHGVSKILHSISKRGGKLESHNTYSSMLASTITVAFGGSVGLEAPIVLTGSSIGSNLGRFFRVNYKTLVIMIACGSAGAIAGIFKSPIAAMIFAVEVLMLDLTITTLIPLLISAVTGATIAFFFMGKGVLFHVEYIDPFYLKHIPAFIVLGIFTGFVSLYFTRMTIETEALLVKIKKAYLKIVAGGIFLGIIIFVFPSLYGEGYEVLEAIISGNSADLINEGLFLSLKEKAWFLLLIVFVIMLMKVVAMAVTTGSGGVGGIFAPSLFVGGLAGFFAAKMINLLPFIQVSELNFTLVGMAGLMSGVMHAPLTGIFLISEITGGYGLFTPLIITATISLLAIRY
ncbi:MAG: chloride channel protein, partial [Bacteroidales bacterium]|nr:chloride channel protein [Bacteroidales bacterium]